MDGGFGEAALMGALVGGGASLLTGSNPLTGALLGGLSGGLMNGAEGLIAGSSEAATKEALINSQIANQGAQAGVASIEPALTSSALTAGSTAGYSPGFMSSLGGMQAGQNINEIQAALQQAGAGATQTGLGGLGGMSNIGATQGIAGIGGYQPLANLGANAASNLTDVAAGNWTGAGTGAMRNLANSAQNLDGSVVNASKPGMFGQAKQWWGGLSPLEKAGVGIGGMAGINMLMQPPKMVDPNIGKKNIDHPLTPLDPNFEPYVATPNVYHPSYAGYAGAGYAQGGIAALANGGTGMGGNTGYPQGRLDMTQYATPSQMPISTPVINSGYEQKTNPYTGEPVGYADGGDITAAAPSVENAAARVLSASPMMPQYATGGGIESLGGYASGGNPRLLKGPGDGMSDNIPAVIGNKQPARLADGEFVVPADVVSHLGNGSTDAGAKHLYAMMDKVRTARTGKKAQGKQIKPEKYLPA